MPEKFTEGLVEFAQQFAGLAADGVRREGRLGDTPSYRWNLKLMEAYRQIADDLPRAAQKMSVGLYLALGAATSSPDGPVRTAYVTVLAEAERRVAEPVPVRAAA